MQWPIQMLDTQSPKARPLTLVAAVIGSIQGRIDARSLVPGARLPSVRGLAETMNVSKSTVVEAYDRLIADGAIIARRGSGFYVAGATRPLSLAALGPQLDRAIDPLWLMRQSLQSGPETLKPGSGWLPEHWMPDLGLQRGLRAVARGPSGARIRYDVPLGFAPLRLHHARHLAERGVAVHPDQILLTDSASQSLDLLCRFLLAPGDKVLVDDPCYFNFLALFRAHRVKAIGVPFTPDGPDVDAFQRLIGEHRPRFYLTIAGLHNPTGATISPVVAHRVLKLVEHHDVIIIEDDIFADFEPTPAPRFAGFDGFDRVIQIGSLSKTVSAAVRCGYIAARPEWIEQLVDIKLAISQGNGHLSAVLLHRLLADGGHRRHLEGLRAKLSVAMGQTIRRLGALGLTPWVEPRGGLFLWAKLPGGLGAADIARHGLRNDVVFAPGDVFSLSDRGRSFLRFNVAQCAHPRVFEVLEEAMGAAQRDG
jgi:DNA-binding transcriptional MocR family regulator